MSVAQTCKSYAQERSAKEILMPALIVSKKSKTVKESQTFLFYFQVKIAMSIRPGYNHVLSVFPKTDRGLCDNRKRCPEKNKSERRTPLNDLGASC